MKRLDIWLKASAEAHLTLDAIRKPKKLCPRLIKRHFNQISRHSVLKLISNGHCIFKMLYEFAALRRKPLRKSLSS